MKNATRIRIGTAVAVSVALIFLDTTARAQGLPIDVLIVYDQPALNDIDQSTWAPDREFEFNALLDETNVGSAMERFRIRHHFEAVGFVGAISKTKEQALAWLEDQNNDEINSGATALRELYAADAVVMVVNAFAGSGCGKASATPTNINVANRNIAAFAVVQLANGCAPEPNLVLLHEIGHLLYGEHGIGDPNTGQPRGYNHGWISPTSNKHTVMYNKIGPNTDDLFSDPDQFLSDGQPAGDPQFADVVRLLEDDSWNVVALYRSPNPAEPVACSVQVASCFGEQPQYSVSAIMNIGISASSVDYDISHDGGSWEDVYEGSPGCVAFGGAIGAIFETLRAIVQTAYGPRECQVTIQAPVCGQFPGF